MALAKPSYRACVACDTYYGCQFYNGPFFISPLKEQLKSDWWQSLNFNPANIMTERFYACGRHFTVECFQAESRLKKNAIPSLFNADDWNRTFDFNFADYATKNEKDADSKRKKLDDSPSHEEPPVSQPSSDSAKPSQGSGSSYSQHTELDVSLEECEDISCIADANSSKFLVYGSNLLTLFRKCLNDNCCSLIDPSDLHVSYFGSAIRIRWCCLEGHEGMWDSQPFLCNGKVAQGNIEISAAVVFTGNSYGKFADVAECLNLQLHKNTAHYKIQEKCIFPVIRNAFIKHSTDLIDSIIFNQKSNGGPKIEIAADGQCDSPGFSAQYCTISVMNLTDNKIIGTCVKNVMEESIPNSAAMECAGLKTILSNDLKKIEISALCTDKHSSIRRMLRDDFQWISHEFDIWHITKNLAKRLDFLGVKRNYHTILPWKAMLKRHFFWCCVNVKEYAGDNDIYCVLKELWLSSFYHVVNMHDWPADETFKTIHRCCHEAYSVEQEHSIAWLEYPSDVATKLKEIIYDRSLLDDLSHCTRNLATSYIENFHSKRMKYLPKRVHFSDEAMRCRSFLAVIDHNMNVSIESSKEKRYKRYNRATDSVRLVTKKKPLNNEWRLPLIRDVLELRENLGEQINSRNFLRLGKPKSLCAKQDRPTLDSVILSMSHEEEHFENLRSDDSEFEDEF